MIRIILYKSRGRLRHIIRRDVIVVKNFGFVIVAFVPIIRAFGSSIAPQFISAKPTRHCHIDWHVLMGRIAQFVEAPDMIQRILTIPSDIRDRCKLNECKALASKSHTKINLGRHSSYNSLMGIIHQFLLWGIPFLAHVHKVFVLHYYNHSQFNPVGSIVN